MTSLGSCMLTIVTASAPAIRDKGTCEVLIPKDRYDPLAVLAMMQGWEG
jgi:hypothetical protein